MKINKFLHDLCINHNIPIIRNETAIFISNLIQKNNLYSILEIGTAYGYSSHIWAQLENIKKIVTIEKNIDFYNIAKNFLGNDSKINILNQDAFEYKCNEKFDLIFIDGPKSHQEILVKKYLNNLNKNGFIVIDNLFLKKISTLENKTINQLKLLKKVNDFRNWLEEKHYDFKFVLYDIDDGVGVITKNE